MTNGHPVIAIQRDGQHRTDRDVEVLREQAKQLAEIADDPMAPEPRIIRYRHELERLRALIDRHDDGEPNSDD